VARKRFAFEEVFFIQLHKWQDRKRFQELRSYTLDVDIDDVQRFVDRYPFTLTGGQERAIESIFSDFEKTHPMSRLLEGDVGSGKTAIAASASYAVIKTRPFDFKDNKTQTYGNLQVAYMAPTEILATQLFESFITYFKHTGISIGLITGSGCRKFPTKVASAEKSWTNISRTQLLKWVENGEIPILIGTHALIEKSVKFKHLALVIIDEQHRFGVNQRAKIARKEGFAPHLLSMTATPIPRTLALTIYGDLDLTILDEMPAGRKQIITEIIPDTKRESAYEKIKEEMAKGRQLYVICPRIDEPDPEMEMAIIAKSVMAEAKRLKKDVFPNASVGVLHSKMTKEKKEEVMNDFAGGSIDILVATSVVEVGVNVPNATLIIIEGAERFGLAQLHQLRGRVLRSSDQAYCFLFANAKSDKTIDRLKAIKTAKSGFELAELDLALRGSGELSGAKQWGVSDIGMEAIKNLKMVEAAREEAKNIIEKNQINQFPLLEKTLLERNKITHFE
jgi:ATP-dependent DNA helicase RecG